MNESLTIIKDFITEIKKSFNVHGSGDLNNIPVSFVLDGAKAALKEIKKIEKPDPDEINISWCTLDVIERYADMNDGKVMSKRVAREILAVMKKEHDATIGINWEVIDIWTDWVLEGN